MGPADAPCPRRGADVQPKIMPQFMRRHPTALRAFEKELALSSKSASGGTEESRKVTRKMYTRLKEFDRRYARGMQKSKVVQAMKKETAKLAEKIKDQFNAQDVERRAQNLRKSHTFDARDI